MKNRKVSTALALLAVVMVVAAGCSKKNNPTSGGSSGTDKCASDKFGCVTVKAGDPIRFASLLAISGDVATLGVDSNHGIQLGIDYLDGTFDAKDGQLLGHPVTLQQEDDLCSKDGGQAGATKLAADKTIVAVAHASRRPDYWSGRIP